MVKNTKPILSVLIDEEKRAKFSDLARRHSLSMGWLVNQAIDRMIEADSIDIYKGSIDTINHTLPPSGLGLSRSDVEELINSSIESIQVSSIEPTDIENMVKTAIDDADIHRIVKDSIENADIESMVKTSIEKYLQRISIDSTATTEIEPLATTTTPVVQSYDERFAELVETGITTTEIAQKLRAEGFKSARGGEITRKSVDNKLRQDKSLKRVYDEARSTSGT
jgi:hypothetical protein